MVYIIGFSLSSEKGLDFVVSFAFILIFFIFIWYVATNCKSEKERKSHNKITYLLLLGVVLISTLQIVGLMLFFPSTKLSLKLDKIIFMPIMFIVLISGMLILNKIMKENLRKSLKNYK